MKYQANLTRIYRHTLTAQSIDTLIAFTERSTVKRPFSGTDTVFL